MYRKVKRYALPFLIVLLIIVGCQRDKNADYENAVVFRMAEIHPSDYPTTLADKEFARLVEEKTDGRIIIKVYDSQQLGEEKSVLEQVQFGAIDFARTSLAPLSEFATELNVLQLPYIYRDGDHMWKVLNSSIGDFFLKSIEDEGFIGLGWYDGGARNFYNSVREIRTIEDLKGLKFRVMESELMVDMAKALGASVTPMPYGEVYSSIQTGIIDGAENNFPSYDTSSHYEVAKYFTVDEHVRVPEILIASTMVLDRISEEDLEIIKECAQETQMFQREKWQEKEKESEKKMRAEGCVITEIEDKEAFVKAVSPIYTKYAKDYMDIVKQIQVMK
ncbi:MAG: C4-dicarboxylate ABC transporter [Firmicutes bacterium HGW-Firmicutes-1]|jgi:tripartite ATP-independent transporter DctP family solute receptor|nr:MAG: C4-dicarboxylate ABC transporter [Firmicutes bacterium HGW-Firmicutes-1]